MHDYLAAISGSGGRLVFSLLYFIVLANTLSISEFGLFATASAAGVMLSRILAFGFTATLYRIATVKPRLLGVYAAGFLYLSMLSLPVLMAAAAGLYVLFFRGDMLLLPFAVVVAAETLVWRPTETVIIINNGLNRFGRGALIVIVSTALRALAAILFALMVQRNLTSWSFFYLAANLASLAIALIWFAPRRRLRLRPALYVRRLADSLYVSGAEILFYLQMELDKLLVLGLGGARLAGIYAIIMRLVDLTAIPIRAFSMLLVQRMMRQPELLRKTGLKIGVETAVFTVSTAALLVLAIMLYLYPNLLGGNVATAAPLVILALAIPGLRNLIEYQAELLFARGQTLVRAINLALLAAAKAGLLVWALSHFADTASLILALNGVFAALYLLSAVVTYSALGRPAKRI